MRNSPSRSPQQLGLCITAITVLLGASCGDGWSGYDEQFDLNSTWQLGVSLEGQGARPFRYQEPAGRWWRMLEAVR